MPDVAVTVGALIAEGAGRLRGSQISEARNEALRIWSDLAGSTLPDVILGGGRTVDPATAARFELAIERRSRGEPLAHVTGRAGFRMLSLASDGRALIPRPETEGLVELLLQRVRTGVVADVGTGSGCIALSLAQEGDFRVVVGVDSSSAALDLARQNCELLDLGVELVLGDLCRPFRHTFFDALISNPPYLTEAEYSGLDLSVREWEPAAALVSGPDGLAATTRLLEESREVLRPGGWLALEVDCSRAAAAAAVARSLGWQEVTVHVDLYGRERYLLARRSDTR